MKTTTATWSISLDTECPECDHGFDMLSSDDCFWDSRIEPIEHHTDRSAGVEVVCPECHHEFTVDLEY